MKSKSLVVSLVTGAIVNGSAVWANGLPALSQGSSNLSSASVEVVAGSAAALVDGGAFVVSGIVASGEFLIVTLKGAAEVGTVSLRIPAAIAGTAHSRSGRRCKWWRRSPARHSWRPGSSSPLSRTKRGSHCSITQLGVRKNNTGLIPFSQACVSEVPFPAGRGLG